MLGNIEEITEVRYLSDDRDSKKINELVIIFGGNGDLYVSVVPKGKGTIGKAVRICASGGAALAAPGLGVSIARAFRALAGASGRGVTRINYRGEKFVQDQS